VNEKGPPELFFGLPQPAAQAIAPQRRVQRLSPELRGLQGRELARENVADFRLFGMDANDVNDPAPEN
jgi:hypothetical protein